MSNEIKRICIQTRSLDLLHASTFLFLSLLLLCRSWPIHACTLWAATGAACKGGGTLIAKNRDWIPDQTQEIRIMRPKDGHPFLGLYAIGSDEPGCKAGINDLGLVIVSSTASSIPKELRHRTGATRNLIPKLLSSCANVDEVLSKGVWFSGPRNLMIADGSRVAVVEIGPGSGYLVQSIKEGTIAHTNHYIYDGLPSDNIVMGVSSRKRLARIEELLSDAPKPFCFDDFLAFAADRRDGPSDSIFRVGDLSNRERTVATFIARVASDGTAELSISIYNPGQAPVRKDYSAAQLDSAFHQ